MTAYNELNDLISTGYVPTSVERKKALLMYFFVGILIGLTSKKINKYEKFHLKQSMGWWLVFFFLFVLSAFLYFIPYLWIIPMFVFMGMFGIWLYFLKQVWKGEYVMENHKIFMPVFYGIGTWMIDMFDIEENDEDQS